MFRRILAPAAGSAKFITVIMKWVWSSFAQCVSEIRKSEANMGYLPLQILDFTESTQFVLLGSLT